MTSTDQHQAYQHQLNEKVDRLNSMLAPFNAPALSVYSSAPQHYRMRAEFRVWHEDEDLYHIMFDPQTKQKYRVDSFLPACRTINDMMSALLPLLKQSQVLRKKLFQIDYLSGLSGEIVVSLLYHKGLDDAWLAAAEELRATLSNQFTVSIIGRARKQKEILGNDYIIERLPIWDDEYIFKHIENSFTQPNAEVNCRMIEWALSVCQDKRQDLLELYCGAGNFSLPLAQKFRRVIGTEIAKPSVAAAQYNISANNIDNVEIVRLSAEEFVQAMAGERAFSRLGDIDLNSYQFSTVLVDPPRAGLDDNAISMLQSYEEIIYISCNPETLVQNLLKLSATHDIAACALFDQFPFTHHIETGIKLKKKLYR